MKKIVLLLALFAFSFSYSQDWKQLFESKEGIYYYKPNTNNTAWVKLVSDKSVYYTKNDRTNAKTVDGYTIILYKFDCISKKIGVIKSTVYSKEGDVLDSYKIDERIVEMDYVDPESKAERLLISFCGKK